ncbi:LysM peptidoglycan-binding domain-containing protein [Aliivibrio fischeri]|uniref:phospholipase effector Tle1 domain-containing protein n=1 Tax=Aliivibrio fischeri TaxID=668 RepID=UPI0012D90165|nr:DUF2235 domain-containing protein [Aliivibrio fischeri]MUK37861.1 LysM peptidoglycan-binding domain-containing protein [Aliivibrio fischeri]MUL07120.1 LysM peptidoglycan-binding domain-containing protein [Aliivibrio fischeri]
MKVWDEKLEKFVEPADETTPKFVNAYFPWNEELAKAAKVDVPHYEPVKEKQAKAAKFEYSIEIACAQDELNTYQVGVFSLGKTKDEANISAWNKTQNEKGFTLLTASVDVDESKTLSREFFISSGSAMVFDDVKPIKQGAAHATESFIPVKPAVQVGERLGWPTEGYFYHFIDDVLVHEYKLMGDGKWTFQVTQSTEHHLTDELLSEHEYSFILLPWKISNAVVARQHLLYLPQKMTTQQLEALTAQWIDENACLLDVNAIVQAKEEEKLTREKQSNNETTYVIQSGDTLSGIAKHQGLTLNQLVELNPQYKGKEDHIQAGESLVIETTEAQASSTSEHTVKVNPETGQRETWGEIATQYGLAAKALLTLNPLYEQDPTSLKVGDTLLISKTESEQLIGQQRETLPPKPIQDVGQAVSFANAYTTQVERELRHGVIAVLEDRGVPQRTPVVNVCKMEPERTLRIGVFFDGTGQNNPNDAYKEKWGNKSRTNVARLFEAYPEKEAESYKIYVSGVGTVDGIDSSAGRNPIIDAGDDEKSLAQAFGVFDDTGAFRKWQSLLGRLAEIVDELIANGIYQKINHIEFDVFGFSRGAALARHFINAALEGVPDYLKQEKTNNPVDIYPNLLGNESHEAFDKDNDDFYSIDKTRRVSIRFAGLFDTVGSFYMAGNDDEGNFTLGLKKNAAKTVFQICAKHEYRKNFPLTALDDGKNGVNAFANVDESFYQEVFPGCHTDIGGGYPSKEQYGRTDLPERLNRPVDSTYNRRLMTDNTIDYQVKYKDELRSIPPRDKPIFIMKKLEEENARWAKEVNDNEGIYGEVKQVGREFLYYQFTPISNALSGLALERMKQQAEASGIKWEHDEFPPYPDYENDDNIAKSLWDELKGKPLGGISLSDWQKSENELLSGYIHLPHDALVNAGYDSLYEKIVNSVTYNDKDQLQRKVFSNE